MLLKKLITKSLLVVAALGVGASAWADVVETKVVDCDFNNGETLFTGVSRMSVSNDNNVKFTCANNSQNGYSLATYNFSTVIGTDASAVKIEFAYWIPNQNAAYRRFFTVGQADLRTGFAQTSYSTAGSMFAFGLARNSSANYFSINGASTTAAASATNVLGEWAHAEIYVNHSTKTVNYKITSMDGATTYYSADNVAFVDASASYCNQLDFFDCQNNVVSYLDNLVITKYVDNSKVATTYTIKYQNASGTDLKDPAIYNTYVGDSYTATSTDMATFYSTDSNKKYVYASGNTSATATATASDNVITLVFNEYEKIAYTVTAKNGEETLGTLASDEAYTDGSTTIYWNKFKQFDGKWYVTTGNYGKAITAAGNTDVAYSSSDIAYFFEAENLNTSRSGFPTAGGMGYSGGSARRNYSSSQMWTSTIDEGGVFVLEFPYSMANASASTIVIKTRDADGNYAETGLDLTTSTAGTFSEEITIPAGSSVAICNDNGYNSNILVDYLTLTRVTKTVSVTSAGWATLYTDKALSFEGTGLTAYTATYNSAEDKITLTEVTDVPENTGVVLKGDEGNYNIPVIASSTTAKGDLTGNTTAATAYNAFDGYTLYVLTKDGDNDAQFNPVNDGEIAAGKAFLKISSADGVRSLDVVEGEASGIAQVENGMTNVSNAVFNLSGQRVAQPTRGLYIVNGKKVMVK